MLIKQNNVLYYYRDILFHVFYYKIYEFMLRYATKWKFDFIAKCSRNGVKSRKISIFKEFKRYDKSAFFVPRQDLPGMMKSLKSSHKPRF